MNSMRESISNYYSFYLFRNLPEGPFQSDALLVPEGCLFDHIHNASRCWPFVRWNQTGATACQERNMQMRSFAMLLPCGISLFSGVEFVCCPKHFKGKQRFYYHYASFAADVMEINSTRTRQDVLWENKALSLNLSRRREREKLLRKPTLTTFLIYPFDIFSIYFRFSFPSSAIKKYSL